MNCPSGEPVKGLRLPWYVAAFWREGKAILLWDGECSVVVDHRRDVPSGVLALEHERSRRVNKGSAV